MDIPPSWAIALIAAGLTGVLVIVGLRSPPGSTAASVIPPITHGLGGGLLGFMSLAFYPALPMTAAIGGMLAVRALETRRWADAAWLAVGCGFAWTVLLGGAMINHAFDPALSGSDPTAWFAGAATVLVAGLVVLITLSAWPGRFNPPR